jgi:hypothetical protein
MSGEEYKLHSSPLYSLLQPPPTTPSQILSTQFSNILNNFKYSHTTST